MICNTFSSSQFLFLDIENRGYLRNLKNWKKQSNIKKKKNHTEQKIRFSFSSFLIGFSAYSHLKGGVYSCQIQMIAVFTDFCQEHMKASSRTLIPYVSVESINFHQPEKLDNIARDELFRVTATVFKRRMFLEVYDLLNK